MMTPLGPPLKLYFSRGASPFPKSNPQAVLDAYGAATLRRVEELSQEIHQLTPDWGAHDLTSGTEWAVREMLRRHPDLDQEGVATLGWAFSYSNK